MAWVRQGALISSLLLLAPPAMAKPDQLSLRRVRFYETGVAYFERSGTIGASAVTLPVPASHLDDALKTLVVFSSQGATRVGGVEFASSVSRGMAKALAGIGAEEQHLGLTTLLESLKGASVELTLRHGSVVGRLVDVLRDDDSDLTTCVPAQATEPASKGTATCTPVKESSLVVMTATHQLQRLAVREIVAARPLDPALGARLGAALDALSGGSARVLKDLRVLAHGQSVSLGYVSEAPVWRASYRLVLDQAGKEAALQGWALLHNDTDEAWQDLSVELVNGRPDSFLFPLAAPRYAQRALVTPEHELSTVPQLMRATPDSLWTPGDEDSGGLGLSGVGEGGGGRGEGIGLGSVGVIARGGATSSSDDPSDLLAIGNLAGVASSDGVEAGALFRYTLSEKLDLRAHGSALVPFLGQTVGARRVALFLTPGSSARSGVYLTHEGGQTLPTGTIAVFDDGGFAGEAALPRLKPHEATTLEYGADLDVSLDESAPPPVDEPRALRFARGTLVEHYARHHQVTERLENRSGAKRDVFIGLPYVNNASVKGADEIVYDSERRQPFAVFALGPRASVERSLAVEEGLERPHPVSLLTASELRALADAPSLAAAERKVVAEAATLLGQAEAKRRALTLARRDLAERESDAVRFREHAHALGATRGSEEVVARLLAAEDRVSRAEKAIHTLEAEVDTLARSATRSLMKLPS